MMFVQDGNEGFVVEVIEVAHLQALALTFLEAFAGVIGGVDGVDGVDQEDANAEKSIVFEQLEVSGQGAPVILEILS